MTTHVGGKPTLRIMRGWPPKSLSLGVAGGDGGREFHPWEVGLLPCSTLVWNLEEIQALRRL